MADSSSMPGPSRSPVLIIVVLVAIAGLVGLNAMSAQLRPKTDEEMQQEAQAKQAEAAKANASPSPSPAPGAGAASGSALVTLSPSGVVGDPKALKEVVVGFEWTPQVQADPSLVYGAVEALQKALPTARIRVVNVDLNPGTPVGVIVGGKRIVSPAPDGSITLPPPAIGAIVSGVMAPSGMPPAVK